MKIETKKSKIDRCRAILKSGIITEPDAHFLYSIFENHPNWSFKKQQGVNGIFIGYNKAGQLEFFTKNNLGKKSAISFHKAISHPTENQNISKAAREAVQREVRRFKKTIDFNNYFCPITKEKLTWETSHVDHYNKTFNEMLAEFTKKKDPEFIKEISKNGKYFTCRETKREFIEFHNENCNLRVVSINANLIILNNKMKIEITLYQATNLNYFTNALNELVEGKVFYFKNKNGIMEEFAITQHADKAKFQESINNGKIWIREL
jgi:acyl carrier protein phosphodiesterase